MKNSFMIALALAIGCNAQIRHDETPEIALNRIEAAPVDTLSRAEMLSLYSEIIDLTTQNAENAALLARLDEQLQRIQAAIDREEQRVQTENAVTTGDGYRPDKRCKSGLRHPIYGCKGSEGKSRKRRR